MLNWFRTKKELLAQIDELQQSRVDLRAELILMTGYRNSWKRKYEELQPKLQRYKRNRSHRDSIKDDWFNGWIDRAKVAEARVEELEQELKEYRLKDG